MYRRGAMLALDVDHAALLTFVLRRTLCTPLAPKLSLDGECALD